ncbi:MAG TPA: Txe/YoeB family addiction module toxin [Opitutaceae bacterium]|nr:Txe/YoeB family addiction module toxin [Opitutaceae bacterium]
MKLVFSENAWAEYLEWQRSDPAVLKRINQLLKETSRDPFQGIGKPEPLRHALKGWWSRRIDGEHRLVYKVVGDQPWIAQLRYHY